MKKPWKKCSALMKIFFQLVTANSYATVGLGAAVGPVRVDASYWIAGKESPVKNTWAVGLSLFF